MCDLGDKLLNGVKSMYVGSLTCMRVKEVSVKEWCDTRLCQVSLAFQRKYGCCNERSENGDREDGSDISGRRRREREIGLLSADDLVLCGELDEGLKVIMGSFVEV